MMNKDKQIFSGTEHADISYHKTDNPPRDSKSTQPEHFEKTEKSVQFQPALQRNFAILRQMQECSTQPDHFENTDMNAQSQPSLQRNFEVLRQMQERSYGALRRGSMFLFIGVSS